MLFALFEQNTLRISVHFRIVIVNVSYVVPVEKKYSEKTVTNI